MPTFIDESGETGATSPHFLLGAVWLPTADDVERFRTDVQEYQRRIGREYFEFKWSKGAVSRRTDYFEVAARHPFRFAVAVIDKTHRDWRGAKGSILHWACLNILAATLRQSYLAEEKRRLLVTGVAEPLGDSVIVDDNQDRAFLGLVKKQFRALESGLCRGGKLIRKVRFRNSAPDELIQFADMICGAARAHLEGDSRCYEVIAQNDLGITTIP